MKARVCYLITGTVLLMVLGLIYAWSIFRAPISRAFPVWTISQISLTFTISMAFFCLGGLASGRLYSKAGPRPILLAAAALLFVGFSGASQMNPEAPRASLYMLYILYGVLCGGAVGLAYNAIISTVMGWYPDKAGAAAGILLMGFGIGGMLLGSVVKGLIDWMGLFAVFQSLGVFMTVSLAAGALLLKRKPAAGQDGITEENESVIECSASEMLQKKSFWLLMGWLVLLSSIGLLVVNSAASIAASFGAPEVLGLIVSVFNGIGRVLIGTLFDRLGARKTMLFNNFVYIAAGVLLCAAVQTGSTPLIIFGLVCAGCGYGGNPTITSASVQNWYGRKHYAVNFSVANLSIIPAAFIGPLVSSGLLERSGGAYDTTFMLTLVLAVLALAVLACLQRSCK